MISVTRSRSFILKLNFLVRRAVNHDHLLIRIHRILLRLPG
jgi:hypothetical protein